MAASSTAEFFFKAPAIGLLNTTFRRTLLLNVKPARMSVKGPSFQVETSYSIKAIAGYTVVEALVYTFSAVLSKFMSLKSEVGDTLFGVCKF